VGAPLPPGLFGAEADRQGPVSGPTEAPSGERAPLLRPALPRDLSAMVDLEFRSFPNPWSELSFAPLLEAPEVFFLVAESGAEAAAQGTAQGDAQAAPEAAVGPPPQLLGFGGIRVILEEGEILTLAVDQRARGHGLGGRLLDELLAWGWARGAERVFLEVRPSNRIAAALYESRGFREVGVRRQYYEQPREDARILRLDRARALPPDESRDARR